MFFIADYERCNNCMDLDYLNAVGLCRPCATGVDTRDLDVVTAMELFWGKEE